VAGKVTVGLASHWPCVTDSVVYPPTGSMAIEREMSTPPMPRRGTACFTFNYIKCSTVAGYIGVFLMIFLYKLQFM